jgi:cell division control protein 6
MAVQLDKIFDNSSKNTLFKDKFILQSNYSPENIPHREKQIEQVAAILAPALRGERASNLFIYGQPGTGKTLCALYVRNEMLKRAKQENVSLKIEYLNCKMKKVSDTEYRIIAELIKKLGGSVPATGLPTDQVYNKFIELIENEKQLIILVLDEVDQAVNKLSDNFLYNLTRMNSELSKSQIGIVGISNDLKFLDSLDPRVRSSLGEEELIFPPYNAVQLQDILRSRAEGAFKLNVLNDGVIAKCAAYAAREHGDARRALDLLRVAGEIAEREGSEKVKLEHIDLANEKIDKDKILSYVETAPKQFQLVLFSIISLIEKNKKSEEKHEKIFTGDVYNVYNELCVKNKVEILTQRRVSDIIAEFDMSGIITANVVSKGRHGRTREIKIAIPEQSVEKVKILLLESLGA